jgi:hypothetical protein
MRFEVLTAIIIILMKYRVLDTCGFVVNVNVSGVTSLPEDGVSMFLRNIRIGLQVHTAPRPKTLSS